MKLGFYPSDKDTVDVWTGQGEWPEPSAELKEKAQQLGVELRVYMLMGHFPNDPYCYTWGVFEKGNKGYHYDII